MSKKKEVRDLFIYVRATHQEKELLKAKAQSYDLTLSEWLRQLAFTGKPRKKVRSVPDADPFLIREINRVGNNMNQLARHANERAKAGLSLNTLELLTELRDIHKELEKIRQSHTIFGGAEYDS
ncbi:MobC family plasmid mobilization relaxosome protein [Halomonas sp. 18H]|nr:MobC family plasmid mobilization relaxosome protein [Halomonas sp. 18H]MCW4151992.1 MobC family plasmid mobilization relaxosome protein [Halomonas sp. 18H]